MELWLLIAVIVISLLILALWYAHQSGVFFKITIETKQSPYPNFHVAYKLYKGPYKNVGKGFEDVYNDAPEFQGFAVYYDDPNKVPAADLRAIVGCMLAEDEAKPDESKVKLLTEKGYKMHSFPRADNVVRTWFPMNTQLSILVAVFRVWPKLASYTQKQALDAYPWMEICTDRELHFVGFLDHHKDFMVPEVQTK